MWSCMSLSLSAVQTTFVKVGCVYHVVVARERGEQPAHKVHLRRRKLLTVPCTLRARALPGAPVGARAVALRSCEITRKFFMSRCKV